MRMEASRQELARTAETLRRMMTAGEAGSILEVILDTLGASGGAEGALGGGHGRRRSGAAAGGMGGHRGAGGARGAGPGEQGAGAHPLPGAEALRRHWDQITCRLQGLLLFALFK